LVYGYADSLEHIGKDVIEQIVTDNIGVETHCLSTREIVDDSHSSSAKSACDDATQKRIAHLESMVAKLTAQVNWNSGQIEGGIAEGNDKLIQSLTVLLEKERSRSERYFGRCIALFHKNKTLTRQLEELIGPENVDDLGVQEEKAPRGLLNSFFGLFGT